MATAAVCEASSLGYDVSGAVEFQQDSDLPGSSVTITISAVALCLQAHKTVEIAALFRPNEKHSAITVEVFLISAFVRLRFSGGGLTCVRFSSFGAVATSIDCTQCSQWAVHRTVRSRSGDCCMGASFKLVTHQPGHTACSAHLGQQFLHLRMRSFRRVWPGARSR
jgi:hypothetical protein